MMQGHFDLGGAVLEIGRGGDPWDRVSPSRPFAMALHSMAWLPDLLSAGSDAKAEARRLILTWSGIFGKSNAFSWGDPVLCRRVFALACALPKVLPEADPIERARILQDFARQARHLASSLHKPHRAADQAIAVALAGCVLSGKAGADLLRKGLRRLNVALPSSFNATGGHATRSPQAALELMFDLRTLAGALLQKGMPPPDSMISALEKLQQTLQFFVLRDGCLPDMQGGEACRASYIATVGIEPPTSDLPSGHNGYQRMDGRGLQVLVDAAPPASGPWSEAACAQPLGLDVLADKRRLIVACGWSPDALGPQALRLVDAGSTLAVGGGTCGAPLGGFPAAVLGPRLADANWKVSSQRHQTDGGIWLDLQHDGWTRQYHLRHERRLFLDLDADELRGEDSLTPFEDAGAAPSRRLLVPYTLRFHLHPSVSAGLGRDGRSVVLHAADAPKGWRFRSDAQDISVEASVYFEGLRARRTQQVVLKGQARPGVGARVRWKLAVDRSAASSIDAGNRAL